MELILQKGLEHQQIPVERLTKVFENVDKVSGLYYANPTFNLADNTLKANIKNIQKDVHPELRGNNEITNILNLDIKMETGTGKTYVYAETIFELHKKCGVNKFIIAVPSLPIKAGSASFLGDNYVMRHFRDVCGYDSEIELCVLGAMKKKKGKSYFPSVVRDFVQGSNQLTNKIYVLLVNMQLLSGSTKLLKDEYDYSIEGFSRPFDAIRATKPFVIIDEPHRFDKDNNAYKTIVSEIKPQCIIRFGATFPERTIGKGKQRVVVKDYQNLLYDLNACDAFNKNLIKGVAKEHFEPLSKKDEKVKITNIESKTSVSFKHTTSDGKKSYKLNVGDSLAFISSAFEGLFIEGITNNTVLFSNGQEKVVGNEFDVDIFMQSYQDGMLKLALQRHFETERANFTHKPKIKTLALFFIDDISSYRKDADSDKPVYLREAFESLLKERIEFELQNIADYEQDYKKYLEASLADLSACHAGYFAKDNSDSDEDVANEINEILFDKKALLSLKKKDGSFNTRRFLFSKWTLKEGWDNPNVFTIVKLRSSGSEISKMQEVGRGLRLPVDEFGNRISNEDFTLNYIVDFTEANFAEDLIKEINGSLPATSKVTDEQLIEAAKKRETSAAKLLAALLLNDYVDENKNIIVENQERFFSDYPEFTVGVGKSKVADRNKGEKRTVKIRKAVYSELKELWQKINEKYLLFYDNDVDASLCESLLHLFEKDVFQKTYMESSRVIVKSDGTQMIEQIADGVQYAISKPMPYNEFLLSISKTTRLPIGIIHNSIVAYVDKHDNIEKDLFNEASANNFVKAFIEWKNKELLTRFSYSKTNVSLGETALSNMNGTAKSEIAQGRIGTKIRDGSPCEKYLYDAYAFDSPLEEKNIRAAIDEVVVYGKIPRSSIAIPTITGGFYSPDFMYVIKRKNGAKILNIVIETKDVENKEDLRGVEGVKIENARVFFNQLKISGYEVYFRDQLKNKAIKAIVDEISDK